VRRTQQTSSHIQKWWANEYREVWHNCDNSTKAEWVSFQEMSRPSETFKIQCLKLNRLWYILYVNSTTTKHSPLNLFVRLYKEWRLGQTEVTIPAPPRPLWVTMSWKLTVEWSGVVLSADIETVNSLDVTGSNFIPSTSSEEFDWTTISMYFVCVPENSWDP